MDTQNGDKPKTIENPNIRLELPNGQIVELSKDVYEEFKKKQKQGDPRFHWSRFFISSGHFK